MCVAYSIFIGLGDGMEGGMRGPSRLVCLALDACMDLERLYSDMEGGMRGRHNPLCLTLNRHEACMDPREPRR